MANGIQGLLANPLVNIGAGLLSAAGPSMQPVGIGQGLVQGLGLAQNAQQLQLQNQAARNVLQQQARRQQALQQLPGLLGEGPQAEVLGLLGQIAPEALATGLLNRALPEQRSAPADIRTMAALGIPLTPEGFEQFQKLSGSDIEELVVRSQLQNAKLQRLVTMNRIEGQRAERQKAKETEAQKLLEAKNRLGRSIQQTQEVVQLAKDLRGTPLETGVFQGVKEMGAAVADLAGVQGAGELLAKSQRLRQLAVIIGVGSLEVLRGLGRLTGQEFKILVGNALNPETNTRVILQSAADNFEKILDEAEVLGLSLEQRAEIERLIPVLRNTQGSDSVNSFSSEAEVGRALEAGQIQKGDIVEVGGKRFRVQ